MARRTVRRLLLAAAVLLALVAAGCAPRGVGRDDGAASEAEAERQHAAVLEAYRQGDVEEARALSVQLLEANPDFHAAPRLRRRLAESYMDEARWDLALHHLGRLLEDYPKSPEAWPALLLRAQVLAETGRRLEAATGLDRALDSWPEGAQR
ncbi:MAG: tetratricopeptide repeat protein, partial [Candidatus Krumholzibacteriota bacterium]|nr:tetratricopeptide repeat protein [Candidatus Krumholzibacteriota bacterium]